MPRDSVETTRGASVDWSNLREDYNRLGNLTRVARLYGCRFYTVRAELERQGIPIKPRGHVKGQKKSDAWRAASSKHWNDPEWRAKQREKWLERLPTMNGPAANSPLERLLQGALIKAGLSFSTQRRLLGKYVVDILLGQAPVVIEADGSVHLRNRDKDAARDRELSEAGYRVFRFGGKPINNDPDGCIHQVIEGCGLRLDTEPIADIRNGHSGPENNRWTGGKRTYKCDECGIEYLAWPSTRQKPGRGPHQFCSQECQTRWQRENPSDRWRTEEKRRAFSEALRKHWADPEWRAWMLARRATAKQQTKI